MAVQTSGYRKINKLSVDTLELLGAVTQTGTQAITGALTITSDAAATVPLTVVAHASQTANVIEAKTSGGTVGFSVGAGASAVFITQLGVGGATVAGIRNFTATLGDATKGIVSRANSGSQSAALFETQNSSGTAQFSIAGNGRDFILDTTTGSKIGTATTQKLGFWNATPVVQQSAFTQTYATASKTHSNPTAATLTVTDGAGTNDNTIGAITADASVIAAVQEIADEINKLVADVANVKQVLNSAIDDLQTIGLLA